MGARIEHVERRLVYVGPVGVGIVAVATAAAGLVLSQVLTSMDHHRPFDWELVILGSLGSFAGAVLAAWLFNLVAPMFGGVRLWLRLESAPNTDAAPTRDGPGHSPRDLAETAARPAPPGKRACPACGVSVRGDRTFCPDCGHDFDAGDPFATNSEPGET